MYSKISLYISTMLLLLVVREHSLPPVREAQLTAVRAPANEVQHNIYCQYMKQEFSAASDYAKQQKENAGAQARENMCACGCY
jgi:hypothetical protein